MSHPLQAKVERAQWWRDHLNSRCRRVPDRPAKGKAILISQVVVSVCEYYGMTPDELVARKAGGDVLRARQIAAYVARRMTRRSYRAIGLHLGSLDHSTVLYSCRKVEELLRTNVEVITDVDSISSAVLHGW